MQIHTCGERAVVLSVSYDNTKDAVREVRRICRYIRNHPHPAVKSVRPGLDCVLIEYSGATINEWLKALRIADFADQELPDRECKVVPVCYELGDDLAHVSAATGLSVEEIIRLHSNEIYEVWMIGFMPGYPYLGELPAALRIPRKKTPSVSVPAGSVAIAEEYVGIYPFQSPGGWHIIGRTPLRIIDYERDVPWLFDYGMKVRFTQITAVEYERMKNEATRN
jgi:KipI family sensor histidine kinase inhibitor